MSWHQSTLRLPSRSRGSYLITPEITAALGTELSRYRVGLLTLFIQHTSCALSLNENWDSDVRADMSDALDRIVPEDRGLYRHDAEGSDDMPAHVKSALIGASITVPVTDGKLALGTWQGDMVFGVSEGEACEECGGHYTGGAEVDPWALGGRIESIEE